MGDVGYLTSLRVAPQTVFQTETALTMLCYALAEEEFAAGGVETFTVHRVPGDIGAYQIFEQYTSAADKRHLHGPATSKAFGNVLARMIDTGQRVRLEPIGLWGAAKALGADLNGDEAWRFTVRVAPENVPKADDVFRRIMTAMAHDEFPTGNVKSYTAFRIAGDTGRYVMYEHFTAQGSAIHATGEQLPTIGLELMDLLITPFQRLQLEPIAAYGTNHNTTKPPTPTKR